ncbi:carbohydrate ABC transporter permease [Candidatus Thiosymbion oneisti]|uniref:carbohydrate ABC transporter permease n=1 Tax=Candidatus Thiosymbion oneisti TaxID=589554 RepID=UPI000AB15499|nr:sugar ABC transporter permease [Candidatus Thiosymbion oneisti]
MSRVRDHSEERLAWLLCTPAALAMLLVTAYPITYAVWLSLFRYDLRFPDERAFVGLANYAGVLTSGVWWESLANTLIITIGSVSIELVLGMLLALLMHRVLFLRGTVRASILVPYAIITIVAALAWKFAFDPVTGFINPWLGLETAWLTERWSAFLVIILTEVWKTTPFMALLLLAGLTLVPQDLLDAARVDGASARQRFFRVTLPLMRNAVMVALLFRTLDAFRIFDTVFVQTRGAQGTETISIVGYHALVSRLNLGLGSAVSVLIFLCVVAIAMLFVKGLGASFAAEDKA